MSGAQEITAGASNTISQVDVAASHFWAFVFMFVLLLMFGIGRVAKEAKTSVKWTFGFEFLFRKLIIGFGENQLDLATTLQNFVDQAVAATLKKESGG